MKEKFALIVIDVQNAFNNPKWGIRNNPDAESNINQLINASRDADNGEVIFVQHISNDSKSAFYVSGEGVEFKSIIEPPKETEKIIRKTVNSAFIGTDLHEYLSNHNIDTTIITGLTTPHCVSTTTRMSGNLGYQTILVEDATASFELSDTDNKVIAPNLIQYYTVNTLKGEFAKIISTHNLIELVKQDGNHLFSKI